MCTNNTDAIISVFHEPNKHLEIVENKIPEINENEVLVKIKYTTICTSDLHTFSGRRSSPSPSILGHEIIGEVVESKRKTDDNGLALEPGDLITWSVYAYDPNDEIAQKGFPQKSKSLFKYGHVENSEKTPLNGGFATHFIIREHTTICKITKDLPFPSLSPINCTHATIQGAIRLAGDFNNKKVLVSGLGILGLSACAQINEKNASFINALDLDKNRCNKSHDFGSNKSFINLDDIETKYDIIIETSGNSKAIENCIDKLDIGGKIVLVGSVYTQPNISISAEKIVRNLNVILGIHNYTPIDLINATNFVTEFNQKYNFENLVEKEFKFENINQAFEYAMSNKCYRVGLIH